MIEATSRTRAKNVKRLVSIRADQDAYLRERSIAFSAWIQKKLDEEIERESKASPPQKGDVWKSAEAQT